MTHPIHAIIGDAITVMLCVLLLVTTIYILFWAIVGAWRAEFGGAEDVPDVLTEEQKAAYALPMGSPRDDGNNFYADGWQKMTKEQADIVRETLGLKAKEGGRDPDGWDILSRRPDPTHPEMMLEVLNDPDGDYDGPDDVEEENDEIPAHGVDRS